MRVWKFTMQELLEKTIIPQILTAVDHHRRGNFTEAKKLLLGSDPSDVFITITSIVESLVTADENRKSVAFEFYQRLLEGPYFTASREFFSDFVKSHDNSDQTVYVEQVNDLLRKEAERTKKFLHHTSMEKLISIATETLVQQQRSSIVGDIQKVIKDKNWSLIRKKFDILRLLSDGLKEICKNFQIYLESEGLELIKPRSKNPKDFVDTVILFHTQYTESINELFKLEENEHLLYTSCPTTIADPMKEFIKTMDTACQEVVNYKTPEQKTPPCSFLVAMFCDQALRNKKISKDECIEELKKAVKVFTYIEDKDVFEQLYRNKLAPRLIKESYQHMDNEIWMIDQFVDQKGYDYTSKLKRMMKDVLSCGDTSKEYQEYLKKEKKPPTGLTCKIIQDGAWPFPQPKTPWNLPKTILDKIEDFENYYQNEHQKKKLKWLHHWSICEINYYYKAGEPVILAGTSQHFVVLERFNEKLEYTGKEIQEHIKLEETEAVKILTSLVKAKILIRDGERTLGLDAKFTLNTAFTSKHLRLDLKRYMQSNTIACDRKKLPENKTLNALTGDGESSTIDEALTKSIEDDRRVVLQASIIFLQKSSFSHAEKI